MNKRTIGTVCTGIDGVGVGARDAGLELAWGIEIDPRLAEVANTNLGNHVRVADMLDCDPYKFEWVNNLHFSLPCTRASVANNTGEINEDGLRESPLDIALANKSIEFIEVLKPDVVTIENVYAWRKFQSWRGGRKCKGIQQTLWDAGYWLHADHVNCADFGVPQTRKRLIVRAVRGGFVPYLPQPKPWASWYSAIEDLIPGLPDSEFAPWQLARLPEELRSILFSNTGGSDSYGDHHVYEDEPSGTIMTQSLGRARAFIVEGSAAGEGNKFTMPVRMGDEPVFTMRAVQNNPRAFIVDGKNSRNFGNDMTILPAESPIFTIQASQAKGMPRAYIPPGRVVSMTPRCLARFQSFPDWFQLSGNKTLDSKGLGNAVPPLLMKAILEGLSI